MHNKELMKVSNVLINQPLQITAKQYDLIMYIGLLLQKSNINVDDHITLNMSRRELLKTLSINNTVNNKYIDNLFNEIQKHRIEYKEEDYLFIANLISVYIRIDDNINISIHREMAKLFLELKEQYTIIDFNILLQLSSIYSKRAYLLFMQYRRKQNHRTFFLDDFKKIMCIEEKYPDMSNIKIKILNKLRDDINKVIPAMNVKYSLNKTDTKDIQIHFTFDFSFIKELPQTQQEPQQEQEETSNNQDSEETQQQEEVIKPEIKPSQFTKPVENKDQYFKSYQEKAEEYKKNVLEKLTADYIYGWCAGKGIVINAEKFLAHYESFGWVGPDGRYIMNWQSLVKSWELRHTPEQREDALKAYQKWESEYASRELYNKLKEAGIDNKDFAAEMHSKNLEYLFNYEEKRFYTEEELDREYSYPEKCFYNRWGYMLDLI